MKVNDRIQKRLKALLELGEQVLATRQIICSLNIKDPVDRSLCTQWTTSCQVFLGQVFGEDSNYYKNFTNNINKHTLYYDALKAQAVMQAAADDLASDAIFRIYDLAAAELLDNFLEQAEELLSSGYIGAAAVICGIVLEDSLRRICAANNINLQSRSKLDSMNTELAKKGIYNKLVQKKITALADIRNNAAHGNWNEFTKKDVHDMLLQVRDFTSKHMP